MLNYMNLITASTHVQKLNPPYALRWSLARGKLVVERIKLDIFVDMKT